MSIDEAIAHAREVAERHRKSAKHAEDRFLTKRMQDMHRKNSIKEADEHEQLAEWLEKLKNIENIILKWNAELYNDEDNGIPDNEILEAIFNACTDNGFDIPVDEDYREVYNKAIDDLVTEICKKFTQEERNGNVKFYACNIKQCIADLGEQLKSGK